jgi:flagellar protein FlgJ
MTPMVSSLSPIKETEMLAVKVPTVRPLNAPMKLRPGPASEAAVEHAAKDFEAQFISQMLSNMFSTVDPDEMTGGGDAEEVYQSMLVNEYGKIIARTGGVGVADHVKRIMIEQQGVLE